jgi:hypothetical protein
MTGKSVRPRRRAAVQLLEQVFNGFAGALDYFGSSFHPANSDVLACIYRAFSQVGGCVDGMKGH